MFMFAACGPAGRNDGHGGGGGGADGNNLGGIEGTPDTCMDGVDNDGNGVTDCADPKCSGIGSCPVCGMVEHPAGTPVDLPDGLCGTNDDGICSCVTDADCASLLPSGQHCFTIDSTSKECRQSYTSGVTFTGFGPTQTMQQPSDIVSVCVNMSHEWVRDLQVSLLSPSGQRIVLSKFEGRDNVTEYYLGHPLNTDGDCAACTQEMGFDYCWTPTATNMPILEYINNGGTTQTWNSASVVPGGDYQASDPWTVLNGAMLNGKWTLEVTDLWPLDAGKIHSWTIAFNPMIVQDCSGPIIQ